MKILIPTDGSEFSQAAIDSVVARFLPDGTEIQVLSVLEPLVMIDPALLRYESAMGDELKALQLQHTNEALKTLKKKHPNCSVSVVLCDGCVVDEITRAANQWNPDVIVMGSHGRRGFQKFLLGSVTEKVIAHCPCTVEVVKLPRHDATSVGTATKVEAQESGAAV